MSKQVPKIPKLYNFTVDIEGKVTKLSVPSFGRSLTDDFDLDSVVQVAGFKVYEEVLNNTYNPDQWPLILKFTDPSTKEIIEAKVELSFAPVLRLVPPELDRKSKSGSVVSEESSIAEPVKTKRKRSNEKPSS